MSVIKKPVNILSILFFFFILLPSHSFCIDNKAATFNAPLYDFKILNIFPHDQHAFTQGLIFEKGVLFEGTGLYGKSQLTKRKIESIKPLKTYKLPSSLFGEGITIIKGNLIQLTWRAGAGLVYDPADFRLLKSFSYSTEGWGITNDGNQLIMSNGTATLYFLDPDSFKEIKQLIVLNDNKPVSMINELEFINGKIYANIWRTDRIAIIDPGTGRVEAWINLEKLATQAGGDNKYKTLNGIAYDAENDRLFVTGKLWPYIYEIKIIPENQNLSN